MPCFARGRPSTRLRLHIDDLFAWLAYRCYCRPCTVLEEFAQCASLSCYEEDMHQTRSVTLLAPDARQVKTSNETQSTRPHAAIRLKGQLPCAQIIPLKSDKGRDPFDFTKKRWQELHC